MKKNIFAILTGILTFLIVLSNIVNAAPFTATNMHELNKASSAVPSPDGKFVVYVMANWKADTGKTITHLAYTEIATKKSGVLTDPKVANGDNSPVFSKGLGNTLLFLSSRSGKSQIWQLEVPATPSETPPPATQLTNYPIDIINFKVSGTGSLIVFAAEVYTSCVDDLQCTADNDKIVASRGKNTYEVYDTLLMRHWDHWKNKKVSHIFVQKITKSPQLRKVGAVAVQGQPLDMMLEMNTNSPVGPFGGAEMYDIAPDDSEVAFTGADRTFDEAWNTGWKIYTSKVGTASTRPVHITKHTKARTTNPHYSLDGTKIAYLAMDHVNVESDKLHLEVYDRTTKSVTNVSGTWDRSVNDYVWEDANNILAVATQFGINAIFNIKVAGPSATDLTYLEGEQVTQIDVKAGDIISSSVPVNILNTKTYIVERNSYNNPTDVWLMDVTTVPAGFTQITNFNSGLSSFEMVTPDSISFPGGNGDPVQGWLFKPINFNSAKKYPLALLIHGGPESAWVSSWSYRWNPQLWANAGYAVICINPHGSVGQGQKYTDLVRNDWGGLPYQDLMLGVDYVIANNAWIDGNRSCAAGGSYGGFMINWIQGQTNRFKCLVCHDGVFSSINMAYATDELWFPMAENCPLDKVGCKPWDPASRDGYFKFSPEAYVSNWKTPELVIHGSNDLRIPISEAVSMFTTLQVKNIPSRFLHFPQENHWTLKPENSIKWYSEVLGWMNKWTENKSNTSESK